MTLGWIPDAGVKGVGERWALRDQQRTDGTAHTVVSEQSDQCRPKGQVDIYRVRNLRGDAHGGRTDKKRDIRVPGGKNDRLTYRARLRRPGNLRDQGKGDWWS